MTPGMEQTGSQSSHRERLAQLKRERDDCRAAAQHWNRAHPGEEPLPEEDDEVDRAIDAAEAAINNGGCPA